MRCTSVQRGDVGKREATLREEPRLAFPLLLFPPCGGRSAVPHGKGSSTHKKTPTLNGRGQPIQAAAPFPRKDVSAPCRAGLLARGVSLLSAPSQGPRPQWSPQISIRLQLRGSDGFAPSSLATASCCETTWYSSSAKLFCYANMLFCALSTRKSDSPARLISASRGDIHGVLRRGGDAALAVQSQIFTPSKQQVVCVINQAQNRGVKIASYRVSTADHHSTSCDGGLQKKDGA